MKPWLKGHGSLEAAPFFFFFFRMLVRQEFVEAQVKSWFEGHGFLEVAPLCHGNGNLDASFLVDILPRGCLQEIMTRFVHRRLFKKIVWGSFCISEEVDASFFFF